MGQFGQRPAVGSQDGGRHARRHAQPGRSEWAMSGILTELALIAILVALNAVFAGSEMALVSLREGQLQRLERASNPGRRVARLARDPNRFLATIQIGITLAGFLASATAAVGLAEPLVPALSWLDKAAEPVAIVVVTFALTFLTLVFGELAPKRVAMQHAERWALFAARPLSAVAAAARPLVWSLARASDLTVRAVGSDPSKKGEEITPAEIRDLVASQQGFTTEQRMIMSGAVEIAERVLRQVLVPRRMVFTIDADSPGDVARDQLAASGHSRAPVVRNANLDDTVGVVVLRELVLTEESSLLDAVRPAYLLPDSLRLVDALRRFKDDRQQMALVVDERGAVDGIVTLEDLLEELVGEIYAETDRDVVQVRREPDGSMLLPGTFPLHDLPDVGIDVELPDSTNYTTIAGLILARLGHVPDRPGEIVNLGRWAAEVSDVERRAISAVRLSPNRSGSGSDR